MNKKKEGGMTFATHAPRGLSAAQRYPICKEITILLSFFRYTLGSTTREAARCTGIKRRSVCWYVAELQELGLLKAVFIARDKETHRKAKHYSANVEAWHKFGKG